MKKVIFSAAAFGMVAVSGMALAPTTAEAIPAFARQTGAACLSCHFQTFPALKAFGRAFKRNSFTDVGDEALVEDDNLSIPAVLNATVVIRGDYTSSKNTVTTAAGASVTTKAGVWNVPSETPILIAGRLGTNTGAFIEFANGGTNGGGATIGPAASQGGVMSVGNWQLLNSWDVGDFKIGLGAHNSGFGGSAVFETSNVFGQHSGKLGGGNLSAINNIGFNAASLAIGGWVGNDMGDIQLALIAPSGAQGTDVALKLGKLVRGHFFTDVAGWDTMIGFGVVTGKAGKPVGLGGAGVFRMDLQFVDLQAQGEMGDMSIGVYADYAQSKDKAGAGEVNFYGLNAPATGDKTTGYSARVEVKPLHNMGVGLGFGSMKLNHGTAGLGVDKMTQFQIAGFYEVYQNLELNLIYNTSKVTVGAGGSAKANTLTLEFEGLL